MSVQTGIDLSADFHTYGVLWEEGLVVWYIDGREVRRLAGVRVSDEPMNIMANQQRALSQRHLKLITSEPGRNVKNFFRRLRNGVTHDVYPHEPRQRRGDHGSARYVRTLAQGIRPVR